MFLTPSSSTHAFLLSVSSFVASRCCESQDHHVGLTTTMHNRLTESKPWPIIINARTSLLQNFFCWVVRQCVFVLVPVSLANVVGHQRVSGRLAVFQHFPWLWCQTHSCIPTHQETKEVCDLGDLWPTLLLIHIMSDGIERINQGHVRRYISALWELRRRIWLKQNCSLAQPLESRVFPCFKSVSHAQSRTMWQWLDTAMDHPEPIASCVSLQLLLLLKQICTESVACNT